MLQKQPPANVADADDAEKAEAADAEIAERGDPATSAAIAASVTAIVVLSARRRAGRTDRFTLSLQHQSGSSRRCRRVRSSRRDFSRGTAGGSPLHSRTP